MPDSAQADAVERWFPRHAFEPRHTPTWIHLACALAGHRPPDLSGGFRYVHLGGPADITPAVVAAVHPAADVEYWSHRPEHVEAGRRVRDELGLGNMTVDERPDGPHPDDRLVDVMVVSNLLERVGDDVRRRVAAIVEQRLRPGGLLCMSYDTTVGWGEIEPVVRLMRYVASRSYIDDRETIPAVRDLLHELRAGGARYLTDRPIVAEWLDAVDDVSDERLGEMLVDEFRPLSHAQAVDLVATRAEHIGSAALLDDLGDDVPEGLRAWIDAAPTSVLRETYRDLAVRRRRRHDLFRVGRAPLDEPQQHQVIADMQYACLEGHPELWAAMSGSELADDRWRRLRASIEAGAIHPLATGIGVAATNTSIPSGDHTTSPPLIAVAKIGGAVPDGASR